MRIFKRPLSYVQIKKCVKFKGYDKKNGKKSNKKVQFEITKVTKNFNAEFQL